MREQRCRFAVVRQGYEQPCDNRAVAQRFDAHDQHIYPVCGLHTREHYMVPLDYVERRAAARALKEAARVAESEAEEQWRKDRGEGMPGGVSLVCAQYAAQSLDVVARVLNERARREASVQ